MGMGGYLEIMPNAPAPTAMPKYAAPVKSFAVLDAIDAEAWCNRHCS